MPLPVLTFNLHDATILQARLTNADRLELDIELYEIFYPGRPRIQLIISGIKNAAEVNMFYELLLKEAANDNTMRIRIDGFGYDDKKLSTQNNLFLLWAVDRLPELRVHCTKINFLVL